MYIFYRLPITISINKKKMHLYYFHDLFEDLIILSFNS